MENAGKGLVLVVLLGVLGAAYAGGWFNRPRAGDARGDDVTSLEAPPEPDEPTVYENWYPETITPPEGTEYPCALTALPLELPGVPDAERAFMNHTYTKILEATQLKLVILAALYRDEDPSPALATYEEGIAKVLEVIEKEGRPRRLTTFKADVIEAIGLQRSFFQQAAKQRKEGKDMNAVLRIPAGRQASKLLLRAWGKMQKLYSKGWTPAMKDSVFHHLCALDLF